MASLSYEQQSKDGEDSRTKYSKVDGGCSSFLDNDSTPCTTENHPLGEDHFELQGITSSAIPTTLRTTWRQKASNAWQENRGVVLMIFAQFFGSAMAAIARLMETQTTDETPMHPFQILFARQSVTVVLSLLYMWWARVPEAPLGPRKIRPILALRGFGGFFGVAGLYFSLIYLPLADAIVMTFIAPMIAAWISSFIMKTPFTRSQQLAGIVSLIGVVLITRPVTLFQALTSPTQTSPVVANMTLTEAQASSTPAANETATAAATIHIPEATPTQRAFAVLLGLIGVLGASCAYVTISWIGKQAHPLISVNYFATWCTLISTIALIFIPSVPFRLPATLREWLLLLSLGVSGFVMQFLLTSSLAHKRSNKVLNIVYIQMVFALGFDKILFNQTPGLLSILGSSLILGSVIWVAVRKEGDKDTKKPEVDAGHAGIPEEEVGLVSDASTRDHDGVEAPPMSPSTEPGQVNLVAMQEIHR